MSLTTTLRTQAHSSIMEQLNNVFPEGKMVMEGKRAAYAIPTNLTTDNGQPIWATLSLTIKNPEATEKTAAFDCDAAHEAYEAAVTEKANRPAKTKTAKDTDAVRAANAAKRQHYASIVSNYVRTEMPDGVEMCATDFLNACPELVADGLTALQMGKIMDLVVGEQILTFERKQAKKWYTKA